MDDIIQLVLGLIFGVFCGIISHITVTFFIYILKDMICITKYEKNTNTNSNSFEYIYPTHYTRPW